jgi:hypothetical protein
MGQDSSSNKVDFYDSYNDWQERKNKHWQGFDMGVNGLVWEEGSDVPPPGYEYLRIDVGKSFNFMLNLFEVGIPIKEEYVKIVTGLGFEWNNLHIKGNSYMYSFGDTLTELPETRWSFKKNNMKSGHLTVPLLLGFNTGEYNNSSWHLAFGVIGSLRLSGKQKVEWEQGGNTHVLKIKSRMHQNPWRVQATVRAGYANFHLFANYALTDYWLEGEGPRARLWSIGLKLIPW